MEGYEESREERKRGSRAGGKRGTKKKKKEGEGVMVKEGRRRNDVDGKGWQRESEKRIRRIKVSENGA